MNQEQRLLEDLKYTQQASLLSEQIYPYWENVFAIIVGALVYIFFQEDNSSPKIILCIIGSLFSSGWFFLAPRNQRFADARIERIKLLEQAINATVPSRHRKITVRDKTVHPYSLYKFIGDEFGPLGKDENLHWYEKLETWKIRKAYPCILLVVWLFLLSWTLWGKPT